MTQEGQEMFKRFNRVIDAALSVQDRKLKDAVQAQRENPGEDDEVLKRTVFAFRELGCKIESIKENVYSSYAEPGYSDPDSGMILLGNWNGLSVYDSSKQKRIDIDDTMPRLAKIFESMGIELEWEDEWTSCYECSKLVRTSADSYSWTQSFFAFDTGELICHECIAEDPKDYLENLENSPTIANTMRQIDLEEHGYVQVVDRFESGWHQGQDADPKLIQSLLEESGFSRFLFNIDSVGQFDTRFSVWMHEDEANEDDGLGLARAKSILQSGKTDGPSNSAALKRSLAQAAEVFNEHRESGAGGIVYAQVTDEGVKSTTISNEDFIEGRIPDLRKE